MRWPALRQFSFIIASARIAARFSHRIVVDWSQAGDYSLSMAPGCPCSYLSVHMCAWLFLGRLGPCLGLSVVVAGRAWDFLAVVGACAWLSLAVLGVAAFA